MQFLRQYCIASPAEALELVEEPDSEPDTGEVVIAVEATPIHYGDLKSLEGEDLMPEDFDQQGMPVVTLPRVPGVEGVGRIIAVGAQVEGWVPGDRVFLPFVSGTWCDRLVCASEGLIPAPEGDPAPLALMANRLTAYFAIEDFACDLEPGDWILQNAANADVSLAIIRLAARQGLKTVNVVRRESLFDVIKAAGGDAVMVDAADLVAEVASVTNNAPSGLVLTSWGATQQLDWPAALLLAGLL